MKKIILLLLVLALSLSLCACAENNSSDPAGDIFVKPDDYAAVVLVSINPQIRLYIDKDGGVLAVEPVNGDAKILVSEIDIRHKSYETVISEFVTIANTSGYVKEGAQIQIEVLENNNDQINEKDLLDKSSQSVENAVAQLNIAVEVVCKSQQNSNNDNEHEHIYSDATCTDPKTCTTCGATDGSANGHNYLDGVCSTCGGAQENYKTLDSGLWSGMQVVNGRLYKVELSFVDLILDVSYGDNIHNSDFDSNFRDQLLQDYEQNKNALTVLDGAYYYIGSGDGGRITYTVSGNMIQVNCDGWISLSFTRTAGNQLTITNCNEATDLLDITLTWSE